MRPRLLRPLLERRLRLFPAVALLGPRQCGKTTLAKSLGGEYFDLEDAGQRTRLDVDWERLRSGRGLLVLDEVQAQPALFARLRSAVDADRGRKGRFLLLGSVSPGLVRGASESLAGRLDLLRLDPFTVRELPPAALDRLWLCGGYPDGGVLKPAAFGPWQAAYLEALCQRDLPQWGLPAKPGVARRLLAMLAAMQGGAWNASQVGAGLGLSYNTVNAYLDFLEGAFLARRLRPWHANLSKRLVKNPKVYLRDSGLLHALLGVRTRAQLLEQPWVGACWEGFVVEQVLDTLAARGLRPEPFYFRTSDGHELDLVLDAPGGPHAVEIKLTSSPDPADLERARKAAALIHARSLTLICRESLGTPSTAAEQVLNLPDALERLERLLEH